MASHYILKSEIARSPALLLLPKITLGIQLPARPSSEALSGPQQTRGRWRQWPAPSPTPASGETCEVSALLVVGKPGGGQAKRGQSRPRLGSLPASPHPARRPPAVPGGPLLPMDSIVQFSRSGVSHRPESAGHLFCYTAKSDLAISSVQSSSNAEEVPASVGRSSHTGAAGSPPRLP